MEELMVMISRKRCGVLIFLCTVAIVPRIIRSMAEVDKQSCLLVCVLGHPTVNKWSIL